MTGKLTAIIALSIALVVVGWAIWLIGTAFGSELYALGVDGQNRRVYIDPVSDGLTRRSEMTEQSRVWPAKLSVRRYDADGWSEPYPMSVDVDLDAAPISDRSITDADVAADIAEYAGLLPPPGLAPNRPLRHGEVQVLSVANPAWWRGWAA